MNKHMRHIHGMIRVRLYRIMHNLHLYSGPARQSEIEGVREWNEMKGGERFSDNGMYKVKVNYDWIVQGVIDRDNEYWQAIQTAAAMR